MHRLNPPHPLALLAGLSLWPLAESHAGLIIGLDDPFAGSNVVSRDTARTYQNYIAPARLSDVITPRTIVGLGFRLPGQANRPYPTTAITFAQYDLTLGKPSAASLNANALASDTFADNMSDPVPFRAGSLTIPAEALTDLNTGPGVAPSGHLSAEYSWVIRADLPYRLLPGEGLVVLGRHSGHGNANGVPQTAWNFDGFAHPNGARIHTTSASATASNSSSVNNVIKWLLVGQSKWTAGSGLVSDSGNWRDATPPSSGNEWLVEGDGIEPRSITLDVPLTTARIEMRDPLGLTLGGTNTLTLDSPGFETGLDALAGPMVVGAAVEARRPVRFDATSPITLAEPLQADRWRTRKTGVDQLNLPSLVSGPLSIELGTIVLTQPTFTGRVTGLQIAAATLSTPAGKLDLGDAPLVIDYAGTSPLAGIRTMVRDGRLATSSSGRVVGFIEANTMTATDVFYGRVVDIDSILLVSTIPGDATLDRVVDFRDLLPVARAYGTAGTWADGDYDLNGQVEFADLLTLAQRYGTSALHADIDLDLQRAFEHDWARARSMVPEPAIALTLSLSLALRRRRGR